MNAIPQRAYDNYERIQLPRRISGTERGRISDMEAYRMQKVAAERRRLQQQDEIHTARRVGTEQNRRPIQTRTQQVRRPVQEQRSNQVRRPVQQRRYSDEQQGERYGIRQTGVKNVVGGRRLTPAYEGAYALGNDYSYGRRQAQKSTGRRNEGTDWRTEYARPRQAASYGGYAAPAPAEKRYVRGDERAQQIENTAYNGVKPIAVEYESPRKRGIVSTILLIAFVFAVLTGIVIRYASISDISYRNTQIQTQNETLRDKLDKVKMENALSQDLNSIQEKASTELNMYYPTDDQIVYLEPEEKAAPAESAQPVQDQMPVQVQEDATGKSSFPEGIQGFFGNMMEALKGWFQA